MKSEMTALSVYGLEDLIAGKTPTFSGWTNNPTDSHKITDGDPTTFCTTGNKVLGAGYQFAYFEWDLGAEYTFVIGGTLSATTTAGLQRAYGYSYDGSAWIVANPLLASGAAMTHLTSFIGTGSKVRLGLTADAAATITPNVREFHVWRLK